MFLEINYVLSQMEKLSVQALLLISKHTSWEDVRFERATNMSGQLIVGDWSIQVANHFAAKTNMKVDPKSVKRLAHCFLELQSNGIAQLNNEAKSFELTQVGQEVAIYLSEVTFRK
jgi:hypothetical protein